MSKFPKTYSNGIKRIPSAQVVPNHTAIETSAFIGIRRNIISALKQLNKLLGLKGCEKCGK